MHTLPCTQISCVSSSTGLANRVKFRYYFQLVPTEASIAPAYFGVIRYYGWKRVGLIVPSGQPVYILQNVNSPTPALIPLQFQQPGTIQAIPANPSHAHTTLTNSVQVPTVTIPSTLKIDQSNKPTTVTLQTPPPKNITVTQTFNPPKLDGLIQPTKTAFLPHQNGAGLGGQLHSDVGPIRTHSRQLAKERPSPVAFDGE